jgi:hypothetical protein
MNMDPIRNVDESAIKVSQALMVLVLLAAFIFNLWPLVALVAAVNVVGTLAPALFLWRLFYLHILKPAGVVKPTVIPDNPEPQATMSTLFLILGLEVMGWTLTWILILLASVNLFLGFCLGCFTYYQLNRLGVPGFDRAPIKEEA